MTEDALMIKIQQDSALPEFALQETVKALVLLRVLGPEQISLIQIRRRQGKLFQQQVDDLVAGAQADGAAGPAQAEQQIEQVRAENLATLQGEFEFMHALQSDVAQRQPYFNRCAILHWRWRASCRWS